MAVNGETRSRKLRSYESGSEIPERQTEQLPQLQLFTCCRQDCSRPGTAARKSLDIAVEEC